MEIEKKITDEITEMVSKLNIVLDWMKSTQKKIDNINDRTKNHTRYIKQLEKDFKEWKKK